MIFSFLITSSLIIGTPVLFCVGVAVVYLWYAERKEKCR